MSVGNTDWDWLEDGQALTLSVWQHRNLQGRDKEELEKDERGHNLAHQEVGHFMKEAPYFP